MRLQSLIKYTHTKLVFNTSAFYIQLDLKDVLTFKRMREFISLKY